MHIALVSLNQIWEDKRANLLVCQEYITKASTLKVNLIIFPEMTLTGFSNNIEVTSEDENSSKTIEQFQELAISNNIAIVFGVVINDGDKSLNKSFFINSKGELLGFYSKIHPFSFSGEHNFFNPGKELSIIDFNGYKIALTICYDLRFPELYSALAKQSDIIINIANWPKKRVNHWNTLLKARAIENQVYIIGVNRTGIDANALEYEESSDIYNANGDTIQCEIYKQMKNFKIDKELTRQFKSNFNTIQDRRIDLYKEII